MKTQELLDILQTNRYKNILFEYRSGELVRPNYHITEVKNIIVDSVDCGAGVDFWKETIIQLWESPNEENKTDYMTGSKALGILNKVDRLKPMVKDAEVKFEYSNSNFHTAQLFVNDFTIQENNLTIKLSVEQTDCKAKELCGIPAEGNKQEEACCSGSGCC